MKNRVLACGAALAALWIAGSAFAADMPLKPLYKAPPPVAAPPSYSWTECYLGANLGAGWSNDRWIDHFPGIPAFEFSRVRSSGVVSGGQIGCDYQSGPLVIGLEGMFDWNNMVGSGTNTVAPTIIENDSVKWLGTTTVRMGYAADRFLFFVKGGGAWVNTENSFTGTRFGSLAHAINGWTVGGGLEYGFAPNWAVKMEYDHLEFREYQGILINGLGPIQGAQFFGGWKQNVDMVLVGLNYRFRIGI